MSEFPIRSIAVYKHGIGFFSRRAKFENEEIRLKFRKEIMDDILKSFTVIEHGEGKVLGVDFDTSETKEDKLKNTSVILEEGASLLHLLQSLRGKKVKLHLQDNRMLTGILMGSDETKDEENWGTTRISVIQEGTKKIGIVQIGEVTELEILDSSSSSDLEYFLNVSGAQETHCNITVRLTKSAHDLEVSYIAPAPLWTVNYRFVASKENKSLLQGWSIFHNSLEEDLNQVRLSFITGMPISFIYELYNSFTPGRPHVREEERNVPAPITFAPPPKRAEKKMREAEMAGDYPQEEMDDESSDDFADLSLPTLNSSVEVNTESRERDEAFQYTVSNPVSVERGKSAMVPILSGNPEFRKEYIYNENKYKTHPSAVIRMKNTTGLTLEKGPIMILDEEGYSGEGMLDFTPKDAEAMIAYAIDMSVKVTRKNVTERTETAMNLKDRYITKEIYYTFKSEYTVENKDSKPKTVFIEYQRGASNLSLIEPNTPDETTPDYYRFKVELPASSEKVLKIVERQESQEKYDIFNFSADTVRMFFNFAKPSEKAKEVLLKIAERYSEIDGLKLKMEDLRKEKEGISRRQNDVRKNIETFKNADEQEYRQKFIQELMKTETRVSEIDSDLPAITKKIEEINRQILGMTF
ncbi:MAG TPA: hypothetical protein PK453_01135 [Leptospiraceae bacterium]|nr:hypothetical protein [Leptospiraceae bacterium]HMY68896.1 hypothetical protein [Leptospiraceae bacterium]HNF12242.1 hypothetical protein [Leptospiraceae bacterium]HNF23261.1 hypothetical protein [Leptospiraceae bacterium]HNI98793.1 hypothetical protein [Leptospiraceae bacterium]